MGGNVGYLCFRHRHYSVCIADGSAPCFWSSAGEQSLFSVEVAGASAKAEGWYVFLDCLGICRSTAIDPKLTLDCVNAVTGRGLTLSDALTIGRRIINQLRVFNFRHGLDPALEVPSARHGSVPVDGPAKGKAIEPHFEWMRRFYFELMGWDPHTGKPTPETLRRFGLEFAASHLYPEQSTPLPQP